MFVGASEIETDSTKSKGAKKERERFHRLDPHSRLIQLLRRRRDLQIECSKNTNEQEKYCSNNPLVLQPKAIVPAKEGKRDQI